MQDKRDIENVVQEIMGLVDDFGLKAEAYSHQEVTAVELISARRLVESKLRKLVENSFSVRRLSVLEPLGYKGGLQSDDKVTLFFDNTECASTWFESFTDSVDIHNITNTEKKGV